MLEPLLAVLNQLIHHLSHFLGRDLLLFLVLVKLIALQNHLSKGIGITPVFSQLYNILKLFCEFLICLCLLVYQPVCHLLGTWT